MGNSSSSPRSAVKPPPPPLENPFSASLQKPRAKVITAPSLRSSSPVPEKAVSLYSSDARVENESEILRPLSVVAADQMESPPPLSVVVTAAQIESPQPQSDVFSAGVQMDTSLSLLPVSAPPPSSPLEEADRTFVDLYATGAPEEVRSVRKDTGLGSSDLPPVGSNMGLSEADESGVEWTHEERCAALEAQLAAQEKELVSLRASLKTDSRSHGREMNLMAALNAREGELLEARAKVASVEKTIESQKKQLDSAWHRVAVSESEM